MQEQNEDTPLYAQVHAALRQAIKSGRLAAGAVLPSEKELEAEHGVSRITVRRALVELEREGLVVRGRGRQARVVEPLISAARAHIDDDLAAMLDLVRGTESTVLAFKWQLPDEVARARLEVEGDEPVLLVERLRSSAGRPILHTQATVPAWVGAKFDRDTLGQQTMIDQLARSGVTIAEAVQSMHAAPCPKAVAPLIGLSRGDPCFIIERVVRDDRRRPVQHLLAIFRWDSFSYRISSTSSGTGRHVEMTGTGRVGMGDSCV
ncbi:MAG: GntR family transcriptional regulator [Beijerinckiaceae bacterium]|nr:GntR family transcriptional regulator [Beijerinckiaceae bacterium]